MIPREYRSHLLNSRAPRTRSLALLPLDDARVSLCVPILKAGLSARGGSGVPVFCLPLVVMPVLPKPIRKAGLPVMPTPLVLTAMSGAGVPICCLALVRKAGLPDMPTALVLTARGGA